MKRSRHKRSPISSDPAGQLSALLTVVVAVAGGIVDSLRWCFYQWRLRQYRRIVRNAWIAQGVHVDPVRLEERAKALAKARGMPQSAMSKRIVDITVGDFLALAAWKLLKVVLLVLVGIALLRALSIWSLHNEIAKLENLLR